jgi:hypothetical protein
LRRSCSAAIPSPTRSSPTRSRCPAELVFSLFTRAARDGITRVPEAPASFRAFFGETERIPAWVDPVRLERGRRLFLRYGPLAGAVLGGRSLVLGYMSPAGNKPLVLSGRLEAQAPRRLAETGRFVQAISEPRGLDVGADGYQITLKVRYMHAQVRAMIERSGTWDEASWGRPINQHDMAGTTLLFSIAVLDGLRTLGATIPRAEADDYLHLWRVIGGSWASTRRSCRRASPTRSRSPSSSPRPKSPPTTTRARSRGPCSACPSRSPHPPRSAASPPSASRSAPRSRGSSSETPLADDLGLERRAVRHVFPILRGLTRVRDTVLAHLPEARAHAESAGARYWDKVVERSLEGKPAKFEPPGSLGRVAVHA